MSSVNKKLIAVTIVTTLLVLVWGYSSISKASSHNSTNITIQNVTSNSANYSVN